MSEMKIGNCVECGGEFEYKWKARYCIPCRSIINKRNASLKVVPSERYIDETRRLTAANGYVQVLVDDLWLAEHRVIMEKIIGRPLRKGESVHHKNGIKHDNSEENLELWVGPIRFGQRAYDVHCPDCKVSYWDANVSR
jgi:hypothetical protein